MSQAVKNEFIRWLDARYLDTISSTYLKMMDAAEDFSKANGLTELSIYDFSVPEYFEALSTDILQLLANTEITDENYLKMKAAFEHFSEFIEGDGKVSGEDEEKIREILREDDEKREVREQQLEEERLLREKEKEEMMKLFNSVAKVDEQTQAAAGMPEASGEPGVQVSDEELSAPAGGDEELPVADGIETAKAPVPDEAPASAEKASDEASDEAPADVLREVAEAVPDEASESVFDEGIQAVSQEIPAAAVQGISADEPTSGLRAAEAQPQVIASQEARNEKDFLAFLGASGEGESFTFSPSPEGESADEGQDIAADAELMSFFEALDIHPLEADDDEEEAGRQEEEAIPFEDDEEMDEEAVITNFFNEIGVRREDFLSNAREFPAEEESFPVIEEDSTQALVFEPLADDIEPGPADEPAGVTQAAVSEEAVLEEAVSEEAVLEEAVSEEAVSIDMMEIDDEDLTGFFDAIVTPVEPPTLGYVPFHADHVSTVEGSAVRIEAGAPDGAEEGSAQGATFPDGDGLAVETGFVDADALASQAPGGGDEEAQNLSEAQIDELASVDLEELDFSAAEDLFSAFATKIPRRASVGYIPYKADRVHEEPEDEPSGDEPSGEETAHTKRSASHLASVRKKRREKSPGSAAQGMREQEKAPKTIGYVAFSSYPRQAAPEEAPDALLSLSAPEQGMALPEPQDAADGAAVPDVIEMGGTIALGGVVSSMMLEDRRAGQELLEEPEKPLALDGDTREEAIAVGGTIAMGGDIALGEAAKDAHLPSYDLGAQDLPEEEALPGSAEETVLVETAEKESRRTLGDFGRRTLPHPIRFAIGNRQPVEVDDWQDLYVKLINELIPLDRNKLSALLEYSSGEQIYRKPKMLRSGHIIEADLSERTILKNLSAILKLCSVDSDSIRLTLENTDDE